jgi:hypothetical protein
MVTRLVCSNKPPSIFGLHANPSMRRQRCGLCMMVQVVPRLDSITLILISLTVGAFFLLRHVAAFYDQPQYEIHMLMHR